MTRYSILLTTGTTGTIDTEQHLEEGMEVVITLHDETETERRKPDSSLKFLTKNF